MISSRCMGARLAALSAAVACTAAVCAPAASALNPQPLPPGRSAVHITPPDPCSAAAARGC
jgi:hypothetical protein